MNRDEALTIVNQYVKNQNLVKHMLAVEAGMRAYAKKYNQDEEAWGRVGLLHDFDWEIHPNLNEHPVKGASILRGLRVDEEDIRTILSHGTGGETPHETIRDKALFATDELTGLIVAVALVQPSKKLKDVELNSIKKKWKDKRFAAGVRREDIEKGAEELGVDLWEHVEFVLNAMKGIADQLGL